MKIYGIVGTSQQTIIESNSYTPMAGEVLMQSARPDGEYIAQADGTWMRDTSKDLAQLEQEFINGQQEYALSLNIARLNDDAVLEKELKIEYADFVAEYETQREAIGNTKEAE